MKSFKVFLQIIIWTEQIRSCAEVGDKLFEKVQCSLPFQMKRHQMQMTSIVHIEDISIVDISNTEDEGYGWIGEHSFLLFQVSIESGFHREFVQLHRIVLEKEGHLLSGGNLQFGIVKHTDDTWSEEIPMTKALRSSNAQLTKNAHGHKEKHQEIS